MSALPHLRCRPSTTGNRISSLDRKHIILACVFVIFLSGRACVAPRTFVCSVLVVSFMPLCVRCSYLGKVGLSPLQDTYAGGSPGPSRLPGPCAGQAFHPFCIELSLPSRPAVSLGSAGSGESSAGSGSAGVSSDSRPFREGGPPPYGALSGPSRRPFSDQGPTPAAVRPCWESFAVRLSTRQRVDASSTAKISSPAHGPAAVGAVARPAGLMGLW